MTQPQTSVVNVTHSSVECEASRAGGAGHLVITSRASCWAIQVTGTIAQSVAVEAVRTFGSAVAGLTAIRAGGAATFRGEEAFIAIGASCKIGVRAGSASVGALLAELAGRVQIKSW